MSHEVKVVELFAGVGGFTLALNESDGNYKTVFTNQWEPSSRSQFAFQALTKNFTNETFSNENITIAKDSIGKDFEMLVGGFPCQDYSVAATNSKGIEGKKGVLWWEISAIVKKNKPNILFLENVDRLLKSPSKQRGRDFAIMLRNLSDLGYDVEWMVINAADYGFVQRRRRIFIIAWKRNFKSRNKVKKNEIKNHYNEGVFVNEFDAEFINHEKHVDLNKYSDLVDVTKNYNEGKFLNYGVCLNGKVISSDYNALYNGKRKVLKDILESTVEDRYFLTEDQIAKIEYLKGSKRIPRQKPNGEVYYYSEGKMNLTDDINNPARTMLTSEATLNRSSHFIEDYDSKGKKGIRKITPLEAERLNGFKDNWTAGVMTEKQRYFCMGNALVVPLVKKISNAIYEYFWIDED